MEQVHRLVSELNSMLIFTDLFYTTWDTKPSLVLHEYIETAKQIIKQELNSNIKELSQLGGGSINSVFLVELKNPNCAQN